MYKTVHAKKAYNKGKKTLLLFVILLLTTSVGYSALQRKITVNMTSTAKSDFRYKLSCETGTEILGDYQDQYLWYYEGVSGTDYRNDTCEAYGVQDDTGYFKVELLKNDWSSDIGRYITFTIENISDATIKTRAINYDGPGNYPYLDKINTTDSNVSYYTKSSNSFYKSYYYGSTYYDDNGEGIIGWSLEQTTIVIKENANGVMTDITYDDSQLITDSVGDYYYKIAPGEKIHYAIYNRWCGNGTNSVPNPGDSTYYMRVTNYLDFNISKY